MKYIKTQFLIGALAIIGIFGVLSYSFLPTDTNNAKNNITQDPLSLLLDIHQDKDNGLKADFPSGGPNRALLSAYTGPKSAELLQCIAESAPSANEGIVYATIDTTELTKMLQEKEAGTFNRIEIRNQLTPILGYAMSKNQLHWDWIPESYSYEFHMVEGEEALWKCYFDLQSETTFFPRFFETTQPRPSWRRAQSGTRESSQCPIHPAR